MRNVTGGQWDAGLYESKHSFVWRHGQTLLNLLAPKPGEQILDAGCGTGQLTAEIAAAGANVIGIDSAPSMIEQAQQNFPALRFELGDVCALGFDAEFDAVFSNAALHWIPDAEAAVRSIRRALKPGGRFVAEFGGFGNIGALIGAACNALSALGVPNPERIHPWYFPSADEYKSLLERNGFHVGMAHLFDRPTPLERAGDSLSKWFLMFGQAYLAPLDRAAFAEFFRLVESYAAPVLFKGETWVVDYRRLRVVARASESSSNQAG